jgi:hypothetical protein
VGKHGRAVLDHAMKVKQQYTEEADAVSAHQGMLKAIKIADIVVGNRHSKDMGDLTIRTYNHGEMSETVEAHAQGN